MTLHRQVILTVELAADSPLHFPEPEVLAQGIRDGLPDEWYDYQDDDDYQINEILAQPEHSNLTGLLKERIRLVAELEQEKKLVKHLDAEVGRMEEQVNNLVEKNDNQVTTILAAQATVKIADRKYRDANEMNKEISDKYDASLHDWKIVRDQRDGKNEKIQDQRVEIAGLENTLSRLQDGIDRRDNLDRRDDTIKTLRAMNDAQAETIQGVRVAMEKLGFKFGWGNDADLEELERRAEDIENAANTIATASTQLSDSSVDLDAKLDNIRTER